MSKEQRHGAKALGHNDAAGMAEAQAGARERERSAKTTKKKQSPFEFDPNAVDVPVAPAATASSCSSASLVTAGARVETDVANKLMFVGCAVPHNNAGDKPVHARPLREELEAAVADLKPTWSFVGVQEEKLRADQCRCKKKEDFMNIRCTCTEAGEFPFASAAALCERVEAELPRMLFLTGHCDGKSMLCYPPHGRQFAFGVEHLVRVLQVQSLDLVVLFGCETDAFFGNAKHHMTSAAMLDGAQFPSIVYSTTKQWSAANRTVRDFARAIVHKVVTRGYDEILRHLVAEALPRLQQTRLKELAGKTATERGLPAMECFPKGERIGRHKWRVGEIDGKALVRVPRPERFVERDEFAPLLSWLEAQATSCQGRTLLLLRSGAGIIGGCGKTTLAKALAHDSGETFVGPQSFVAIRGAERGSRADMDDVTRWRQQVASALGVSWGETRGKVDAESRYKALFAGHQSGVLVLDDAWEVSDVEMLLPPANSHWCVIVTTRRQDMALGGVEGAVHRESIGRLSATMARSLFEMHAFGERERSADDVAEARATGEIVDLCGGMALALKLVAMYVNVERELTLCDVAKELKKEDERLDVIDEMEDNEIGRGVRASLILTYNALNDVAKHMAWQAAAFPRAFWSGELEAALNEPIDVDLLRERELLGEQEIALERGPQKANRKVRAAFRQLKSFGIVFEEKKSKADEEAVEYSLHDLVREFVRKQAIAAAEYALAEVRFCAMTSRGAELFVSVAYNRTHATSFLLSNNVQGGILCCVRGIELTCFIAAARYGALNVMQWIMDRYAIDLDRTMREGMSALMVATQNRQIEAVELLLERGAAVCSQNDMGRSALMMAAEKGDTELAQLLVAEGAAVDQVDAIGETALMKAAYLGRVEIAQVLIAAHAAVDKGDPYGHTALTRASSFGQADMVQMLVARGAVVDLVDKRGSTPLIVAVLCAKDSLARFRDKMPDSIRVRHNLVVRLLLEAGSSWNLEYALDNAPAGSMIHTMLDNKFKSIAQTCKNSDELCGLFTHAQGKCEPCRNKERRKCKRSDKNCPKCHKKACLNRSKVEEK